MLYPIYNVLAQEENVKEFFDNSRDYLQTTNVFKNSFALELFNGGKTFTPLKIDSYDIPGIARVEESQTGFDILKEHIFSELLFYKRLKIELEIKNDTVFSMLQPISPEFLLIENEDMYNKNKVMAVNYYEDIGIYVDRLQRVANNL